MFRVTTVQDVGYDMALTVGTNSWVTVAEADTYLGDRVGVSQYWDAIAEKAAALVTAYRWLVGSGEFAFPTTVTQIMKDAQCEYALFMIQHQPDIDLRLGLQEQGVIEAGIVKEKYRGGNPGIPYPPIVQSMLRPFTTSGPFKLINLERDDNEDVEYDAYGNR